MHHSHIFFLLNPRPPRPTLFPYTTLFRSLPFSARKLTPSTAFTPPKRLLIFSRTISDNAPPRACRRSELPDRKSTRLNSSHRCISYAVFCLKKKKILVIE